MDNKIYIPYGIKIEKEIFFGFGKKQLKHFLMCILITVILSLAIYLITGNPLIVLVVVLTGIGGGYAFSVKEAYSQSVIDTIKSIITYYRTQQKFDFVYQNNAMRNLAAINEEMKDEEHSDEENTREEITDENIT